MVTRSFVFLALVSVTYCSAKASEDTTCRRDPDRNIRVAACTAIINHSHDRRALLRAYNTRGLALCDLGRCAEAVPDFEHVVALNHSIAGYFDNYARALREAGQLDDAMRAANRAVAMAPTYEFVYAGKARVFEAMGRYADAVGTIQQALRIDPDDSGNWEYAGKLLGLQKNFKAAYAAFDRAQGIDPTNIHVHITRAQVEITEGDTDAAYHDLIGYPKAGPDYAEAQKVLATISGPNVDVNGPTTDQEIKQAKERADKAEKKAQAVRDLNDAQNREIAAKKAKEEADAESKRLAALEAEKTHQLDERKRKEVAAKKAEAEPINVLTKAYAAYILVKRCHEKRDGYATVWINETELARGRSEIKTVEDKLKATEPLDTNAAWVAANERADRINVLDDTSCHDALAIVDGEFKKADPQAAMTKKDF